MWWICAEEQAASNQKTQGLREDLSRRSFGRVGADVCCLAGRTVVGRLDRDGMGLRLLPTSLFHSFLKVSACLMGALEFTEPRNG